MTSMDFFAIFMPTVLRRMKKVNQTDQFMFFSSILFPPGKRGDDINRESQF
jgi:hypothetical protein